MNLNIDTLPKNVGSTLINKKKKSSITNSKLFFDAPIPKEYFVSDSNPQLLSGHSVQNNKAKSNLDIIFDGLGTFSKIRTVIKTGNNLSQLFYNKDIFNGTIEKELKKIITFDPTKTKFTKVALKFTSNISPEVYKHTKNIVNVVRKTSIGKFSSKTILKKAPLLGLLIAGYNIRNTYKKGGNSFEFWTDASLEVVDAFSPVPFTKEILKGSIKYEAKKAQDFIFFARGFNASD